MSIVLEFGSLATSEDVKKKEQSSLSDFVRQRGEERKRNFSFSLRSTKFPDELILEELYGKYEIWGRRKTRDKAANFDFSTRICEA